VDGWLCFIESNTGATIVESIEVKIRESIAFGDVEDKGSK